MLTVKHIRVVDGARRERIHEAFETEFRHASGDEVDRLLTFTEEHNVIAEITDGTTYIMNSKGRTIDRFELGSPKSDTTTFTA